MSAAKIPIASQIAEVKRELALRANTYPRLVAAGKMLQGEADLCTQRMQAVLATLMFCQANEPDIRAFIRERRAPAGGGGGEALMPDRSTEDAILDLLCDEDDELHVGAALTTLVNVVAGLCCIGSRPEGLADNFAEVLRQRIASREPERPRWLS